MLLRRQHDNTPSVTNSRGVKAPGKWGWTSSPVGAHQPRLRALGFSSVCFHYLWLITAHNSLGDPTHCDHDSPHWCTGPGALRGAVALRELQGPQNIQPSLHRRDPSPGTGSHQQAPRLSDSLPPPIKPRCLTGRTKDRTLAPVPAQPLPALASGCDSALGSKHHCICQLRLRNKFPGPGLNIKCLFSRCWGWSW